ncbi:MAG TPA: hypothetical protein VGN37_08180 [Actinocatenispora sp.]
MSDDPEQWWSRTYRVLDAPIPVWVRCEQVFQPRPATYRGTAIRVVAYGIDISHIAPGQLFGWYRLDIGGPYWRDWSSSRSCPATAACASTCWRGV